ncbi:hypothetical protein K2173_008674 [Erythroxylum novogranatense]|uniref:C2H2-type domain-containing protein n=1 Tax=Erythroxylum novogranatense TaxID=1862640 RepID=A0AAV8SLS3_9ROSI|nr:hypothetical protein K2173_008674 [Erythroxylum novogranatense]
MDSKQTCKICNRSFANGKAMGGHMRSHLAKLPLPPKASKTVHPLPPREPEKNRTSKSQSQSQSSSLSSSKNYHLVPSKAHVPPSNLSKTSVGDDGENKIEYLRKRTLSKRVSSVSSRYSVVDDADAALWLVMLSYGKVKDVKLDIDIVEQYMKAKATVRRFNNRTDATPDDECYDDDDDTSLEEDEIQIKERKSVLQLGKYRCKTCRKSFSSYQALGGHKANHSKIKNLVASKSKPKARGEYKSFHNQIDEYEEEEEEDDNDDGKEEEEESGGRLFKCPYCSRVFESGQALGGHKKVHFSPNPTSYGKSVKFFDLNLPAPEAPETEVTLAKLAAFQA